MTSSLPILRVPAAGTNRKRTTMPATPQPRPAAEISLLEAIVAAVSGYRDDHLGGIQSARDPNWVLWHADAASASAQILDLIRETSAEIASRAELTAPAG
jgi:hypothetical protein